MTRAAHAVTGGANAGRPRRIAERTVVLAVLLASCDSTPPAPAWLVLERPLDGAQSGGSTHDDIRVEPARAARRIIVSDTTIVVEFDARRAHGVTVTVPGDCPVHVEEKEIAPGRSVRRVLAPWLSFGPDLPQIGFDAPFRITATPGCTEGASTRVEWKTRSGVPLRDVAVAEEGRTFSARTGSIDALLDASDAWGVVAISPRTRGETDLEARFPCGDATCVKTIRVSAAARSRGLPNVAVGTRSYLRGRGWHLKETPGAAHASVTAAEHFASFAPDVRGAFVLEDADGHVLRLSAGKYDETPLDCGKSSCHGKIASADAASPMATVFERGVDVPFAGDYPACALACHAVGEPGIEDGGFTAVLAELGRTASSLAHGYDHVPASLRRLGGVGCLACHGPGAIPEESARFAILRSDVCATCHDAPPRYGHVVAWTATSMSRADRDPRARGPACARCHTTWGFLDRPTSRPPDGAGMVGIGCAACHAVHEANAPHATAGAHDPLLRAEPLPALLAGVVPESANASRVCLPCHAASADDGTPPASAALIWAGRGGLDENGVPVAMNGPHLAIPGGCTGCHRSGPAEVEQGRSHGFHAGSDVCRGCHTEKLPSFGLAAQARALWARLTAMTEIGVSASHAPLHAAPLAIPRSADASVRTAAWDVALVLEDPAAEAHNAAYSKALLDVADRILDARSRAKNPREGRPR